MMIIINPVRMCVCVFSAGIRIKCSCPIGPLKLRCERMRTGGSWPAGWLFLKLQDFGLLFAAELKGSDAK